MNLSKISFRACPVCGANDVNVLHHQRFALPPEHPLPSSFDVVVCVKCDFVYVDTEGASADYDLYYSEYSKYSDQTTSSGGGGNFQDLKRIEATASQIAEYLPDKGARIVDVGCANGGLLAALRDLGYTNLLGVDPSLECVENTRNLFGIPAIQGWLSEMPQEAREADFVILSHVMEHLLDLRDAVSKLQRLLSHNGMVYVEVPDASRYIDCLAAPFQDFNTEHINHFCTETLENLFLAHGFVSVMLGRKFLALSVANRYPACYALFRRSEVTSTPKMPNKAPQAVEAIKGYVTASSALMSDINERFRSILSVPVIVWGVGQLALKLLVETDLAKANIVAFTDGNPMHHGGSLLGVSVVPPEFLHDLPPHPIVIASMLHHEAISRRIREELHLPNPLLILAEIVE